MRLDSEVTKAEAVGRRRLTRHSRLATKADKDLWYMQRRDLLKLALAGIATPVAAGLAGGMGSANAQTAVPAIGAAGSGGTAGFTGATVADLARALAAKPYKQPSPPPLGPLTSSPPADGGAIRYKRAAIIWAGEPLTFAIEPLHRSRNEPGEVELYLVEAASAARIDYDPAKFEFGKLKPPPAGAKLGFSGFRILHRDLDGGLRPVASLRNASFLTAIARNQVWGPISRPLTVRSSDQKSEEAPQIKAVWLEKPGPAATALVFHGLVDTPSLTGAFRFTLRAEDAAVIDVECTIFARRKVEHFGLTPIQASYLSGPLDRRNTDDVRPAVHEVGGVQMLTGKGEWIWRPVGNNGRLQISAFVDHDPQGFGLLQRNRRFSNFLDDENEWQRRPSVWIEPIGKWGAGEVTLMEVPAVSQNNKNIACYWRNKSALAAGSETHFAYRQFWSWRPPARPDLATVTVTRIGRSPGTSAQTRRRVLVEFAGEQLNDPARTAAIVPNVWSSAGTITAVKTYRTLKPASVRVVFDLDANAWPAVELRLVLEQNGTPVSETWLYRWAQ